MRKSAMLTVLVGVTGTLVFPVWSQPDLKRGGMASEKDAERARKEMEVRKAVENAANAANKDEAKKAFAQRAEQASGERLRAQLQAQGVTDANTQSAILEHVNRVAEARKAVDEKANLLRGNLRPNTAMADAQFNVLFNDYQAALEDYKAIREKSARQLDEKIGYSRSTRLHATLLLLGIVGDAPQNTTSMAGDGGLNVLTRRLAEPPVIMRWHDELNGNQVFNFDFNNGANGAPPNALPFGVPAPNGVAPDANALMERALRAFGDARKENLPGAQPNPFLFGNPEAKAKKVVPQENPDQFDALRREFGEQMKALKQELSRLKAAQNERPAEKKKEGEEKAERVP